MQPVPRWEQGSPGSPGPEASQVRRALARWFVQYNPLYFASSLCILVGIYLVSSELTALGWRSERLLLVGVIEAYQVLVLAGAALLLRGANQRRPAVILALLEVPCLFDWTFQTEALSTLGHDGLLASAAWSLLGIAKALVLIRLFRVRLRPAGACVLVGGLFWIAAVPQVLARVADPFGAHVAATWVLALLVGGLARFRPVLGCFLVLDEWGRTVERRALRATGVIGVGLALLHLAAATAQFGVRLDPAHAAPICFVVALLARGELASWTAAAASLLLGLSPWAGRFIPQGPLEWGVAFLGAGFTALVLGVALSWTTRRRDPEWKRGADPCQAP